MCSAVLSECLYIIDGAILDIVKYKHQIEKKGTRFSLQVKPTFLVILTVTNMMKVYIAIYLNKPNDVTNADLPSLK